MRFNCYWEMPFRKRCRITMENIGREDMTLFYQIDYTLTEVPEDCAYFHAQFRRVNPLPYKEVYTILDGVKGQGHYVGTYMAWGVNNNGWWGEGEIKFYMDGDGEFPTICGTGTEDYFCGSYNFENKETKQYQEFNTPYAGLSHVVKRPTASTTRSSASACTAGTSWTRSASRRTCRSRSRPSAGVRAAATCRCRTTSPRSPSGTRPSRPPRSRNCRIGITWRSSDGYSCQAHPVTRHACVRLCGSAPNGVGLGVPAPHERW